MREMSYRIALIPGDGIGKEVVPVARRVLDATGLTLDFVPLAAGWEIFEQTGEALPDETLAALRECDGALFGAVSSPNQRVDGYSSPIIAMRKALDLYANVRPLVSPLRAEAGSGSVGNAENGHRSEQLARSQTDVDMLIVRENTEGLYVKRERLIDNGDTAIADRVITRRASERIARFAYQQATMRAKGRDDGTSQVTVVHKSNVLSVTDGLFRETVLAVANEFPDVETEEQLVDSMVYRMILEPQRYDVIVAPNLYGDILSDAGAALVGGLGLVPSANVGDNFVLAEPVHGSAPDIAGQGKANPIATIRAAALLLASLGEADAAERIQASVQQVLQQGPWSADLGGDGSTEQVADAVIGQLV